jgi:hypothetical protein
LTPVNGVATSAMRSDAAPALDQSIAPTWTGPHNFSSSIVVGAATGGAQGAGTVNATGLFVNGVAVSTGPGSVGANPTATLGLTAINGVAPTFMRSDAAPPLDQAINPTWSGTHIFNGTVDLAGPLKATGVEGISGQVLSSQGPGVPAIWRTSSGGSIELGWNFSSSVSLANPGSQKMSMNSAAYAAVTFMTFNSLAFTNFDANTILSLLNTGNRIYCQQRNDATKAAVYQVTGVGTNNVGWWNIPVTFIDSRGTIFPNNADMNCVFILSVSSSNLANPTALVGLTPVNGISTSGIRSDGAPALDQAIIPTWTGTHTFSLTPVVPNSSWTYAKIQNVSTNNRLLGRATAGAGPIEEITLGTNLSFTGTTLNAAGGGGSPGGSTTQVQFNNAGAFGGDADFAWDLTNNVLSLGSAVTSGTIQGTSAAQNFLIKGGPATTSGGTVNITGTAAVSGNNGGGQTNITAGAAIGTGTGGQASLVAGSGTTTGTGGNAFLTGGDGLTAGGAFARGGNGAGTNGSGGIAQLFGGSANGTGTGGQVTIQSGSSPSGTPGNILLRTGATTTDRLFINSNGSWGLGAAATVGTSGQVLTSQAGAPPIWSTVGGGVTGLANPTATIGLTQANGAATTAMRSDAAPALNQGIIPTWTGNHIWSTAAPVLTLEETDQGVNGKRWGLNSNGGFMQIQTLDDSGLNGHSAFVAQRSANTVVNVGLGNAADNPTYNFLGTGTVTSGGVHQGPNGAVSAPTYAFSGDSNTGMYDIGIDQLAFSTNSTERLRFDATGAWGLSGANFGTAGQVLTSQGNATSPTWTSVGGGVTGFATPTASIGLSAIAGSATTAIRSDGAPALSQAIAPTWTSQHIFTATGAGPNSSIKISAVNPSIAFNETAAAADTRLWDTVVSGGILQHRTVNDAFTLARSYLQATRSGLAVAGVDFGNATDNPVFSFLGTGAIATGGVIRGPNGSITGPTYSFSGDIDTGMYDSAADVIGFTAGGTRRAAIYSGGLVVDTGNVYIPDGSVTLPGLTFTGDQNTGFYRLSSDYFAASVGGAFAGSFVNTGVNPQFGAVDGAVATPGITFDGDRDTGIYRIAANEGRMGAGAALSALWNTQGFGILDGASGTPSLFFANDPDTGIYRLSSGRIGFTTDGTVQFTIGNLAGTPAISSILPFWQPDGAAGAPSYSFTSDPDTGLYSFGANTLGFAAAGSVVSILSSGGETMQGSGVFRTSDGSTGTAGFSFTNDTDTGLYRIGSGNVGFSADNALVFQTLAAVSGGAKVADFGGTAQTVGFREIPQNSQSANYTAVLADSGKHLFHPNGGGAGDVFTIPANGSVAYPLGTTITFVNRDSSAVSIAITTDTLILGGTATTGTRTLGANGVATAIKVEATVWIITGTGLT